MKLGTATCGMVGRLIVGEEMFPSKSATDITGFFHRLGIDADQRGENKIEYASRIVKENDNARPDTPHLTEAMVKIMEYLVAPDWFKYAGFFQEERSRRKNQVECVEFLNQVLNKHKLQMTLLSNGNVRLVHVEERHVSTALPQPTPRDTIYTYRPAVFRVPDKPVDSDLVAVMMQIRPGFEPILETYRKSCDSIGLRCECAQDFWEQSEIIQDIFSMIWRANVVICDFSYRNANVLYEAGIAHTLGKSVIPITQDLNDIPFDLRQHKHIIYLNNREGLRVMGAKLVERLKTLTHRA